MEGADEFQEAQSNEVEALKAIYMDDFTDYTKPSAWNVSRCEVNLHWNLKGSGICILIWLEIADSYFHYYAEIFWSRCQ